jgi:hypothetical protein
MFLHVRNDSQQEIIKLPLTHTIQRLRSLRRPPCLPLGLNRQSAFRLALENRVEPCYECGFNIWYSEIKASRQYVRLGREWSFGGEFCPSDAAPLGHTVLEASSVFSSRHVLHADSKVLFLREA